MRSYNIIFPVPDSATCRLNPMDKFKDAMFKSSQLFGVPVKRWAAPFWTNWICLMEDWLSPKSSA